MSQRPRFQDEGDTWYTFAGVCLVECPQCRARATSRSPDGTFWADGPWRLVCDSCGLVREAGRAAWRPGDAVDPVFGRPLWLQAACCGHTLWAFNAGHLDLIERFAAAELRNGRPGGRDVRNTTLASRFPRWMITANHRDDVLRGIERLRRRLDQRR